jgi:hypothetical protein
LTDKKLLKGLYEQRNFVTETAYKESIKDYELWLTKKNEVETAYNQALAEGDETGAKLFKDELDMTVE